MDTISRESRSENMRRIRSQGTSPEIRVRRLAHGMGYRFRLYRRDLPGTPDLVFPKHNAVIFVHGCFWHAHSRCPDGRTPVSNTGYWAPKLRRNTERDRKTTGALRRLGWRVAVVWDCQTLDTKALAVRLRRFLEPS